ncbi:MAG: DUF488 domain-containing protein [bacterium]
MNNKCTIKIKRIYDKVDKDDGFRILVDRLWPRGLSKEKAQVDLWLKDIAPSNELRKWFNHDPVRWDEFQNRYKKELDGKKQLIMELKKIVKDRMVVTLLFSASDKEHNNAAALKKIIHI